MGSTPSYGARAEKKPFCHKANEYMSPHKLFMVTYVYAKFADDPLFVRSTSTTKGPITSKIKHAIKLKTSPARLAQLLQPSLAFCFSMQPMTAYRPGLDGTATGLQQLCNSCASLAGLVLCFIACFILLVIAPKLKRVKPLEAKVSDPPSSMYPSACPWQRASRLCS